MFNTSVLGYKLREGKLKRHSEQMNKWLAGFIDADGSISVRVMENRSGRYSFYLTSSISQSASNDPDFEVLRALAFYYNLGSIYFENRDTPIKRSSAAKWLLNPKDTRILFGRITKHLRVKATHADNMMWLANELSGVSLDGEAASEIREYIKCSRLNSRWLKMPKHPSWAWVSGYLDGDGHYRCRIGRVRKYRNGTTAVTNELKLFVGTAMNDSFILNFLHLHFKGSIRDRKDGVRFWQRSLGRGSRTFAIRFLKKMRKYSCLPKKYDTIERMLEFHTTRRD